MIHILWARTVKSSQSLNQFVTHTLRPSVLAVHRYFQYYGRFVVMDLFSKEAAELWGGVLGLNVPSFQPDEIADLEGRRWLRREIELPLVGLLCSLQVRSQLLATRDSANGFW